MAGYTHKFTPSARKLIEAAREEGTRRCTAYSGGGSGFEVDHNGRRFIVDMEKATCDCRRWEITGIPCPHAMCCIVKTRTSVDNYVSNYYTVERYMSAYNEVFHPVPDMSLYEKSGQIPPLPPKHVVQPGKPKKNSRQREPGEELPARTHTSKKIRITGTQRCSKCGQPGHNKISCVRASTTRTEVPNKTGGRPKYTDTTHIGTQRKKYPKKETVKKPTATATQSDSQPHKNTEPSIQPQPKTTAMGCTLDAIQRSMSPRNKKFFADETTDRGASKIKAKRALDCAASQPQQQVQKLHRDPYLTRNRSTQ